MSYDGKWEVSKEILLTSQSLWNRAMSYDVIALVGLGAALSQSLWNRAMSYDNNTTFKAYDARKVSIPLEQGNVLRLNKELNLVFCTESQSLWNRAMSYDLQL